jgi:DNA-binding MarR family transcriptional regulator
MSRIVAGMERSGLAKVDPDAGDARRIRVSVTSKGVRLLQQARERRIRLLAAVLDQTSAAEVEVLREAAEIVERAVRAAVQK